jgi:hypothetical protein
MCDNWISIKDELPDKTGWYLIFAESEQPGKPFINMAFFNGKKFIGLVDVWLNAISHWMPLPGPPDV